MFSGIGAFSLGFERCGFETVLFCENDKFCRSVLREHWPRVPIFHDVKELKFDCDIDILCGGFPCTDISDAGAMWGEREGLDGEASGLWSEMRRVIGEVRPRYIVVENVAAILHRGLGDVLRDLAEVGYDAEWHCIPASHAGGSHLRDRIFIVAYADSARLQGRALINFPSRKGTRGKEQLTRLLSQQRKLALPTRGGRGVHDGVSGRVAKLQALGNSIYVPVVEQIGKAISRAEAQ